MTAPSVSLSEAPGPFSVARGAPRGSLLAGWRLDAALAAGLMAGAALIRLPYLLQAPRFTDEVHEILLAVKIAHGSALPLTNVTTFIGAFYNYLLAALFVIFGQHETIPRLVVFVGGVATVGVVYGLGRTLGGRLAGVLAAALLAVSAEHVLLNSHVAWSVCLSPLFVAGTTWTLVLATRTAPTEANWRGRGAWLLAGSLAGLALQTHGTVSTILVGLVLYAAWAGRRWLRTPWPWLSAALLALFYSNMILYNALSGLGTLRGVRVALGGTELTNDPPQATGLAAWPGNFAHLAGGLARVLGSAVLPSASGLDLAFATLVTLLALAGIVHALRAGHGLPVAALLSAVALMPLLNGDYAPVLSSRYIVPLALLGFVLVALLLAHLIQRGGVARSAAWALAALLLAIPLVSLGRYYALAEASGCTNQPQFALVDQLQVLARPGERILLDRATLQPAERLAWLYLLTMRQAPVDSFWLSATQVPIERAKPGSSLMLLRDDGALLTDLLPLEQRQGLTPTQGLTPASPELGPLRSHFGVYRVTTSQATQLLHLPVSRCDAVDLN